MTSPQTHDVTGLLNAWCEGDPAALDLLVPLVYAELRRVARRQMRAGRHGAVLETTALIHEAYLKLIDVHDVRWQNRAHFFAISATLMRQILVDTVRARNAGKRGGDVPHIALDEAVVPGPDRGATIVALDDALNALARVDPRKSQVVELRYFGGLSVEETAEVLKVSDRTVLRDWAVAKLWLGRELGHSHPRRSGEGA
jgi:RNA polymerase sigma factor (TIGR02999 family)